MALNGNTNEEKIWNFLYSKLKNPYGVAGIMGNMYAESGLRPNNLQNSYEAKLGYTDDSYTSAVDKKIYTNFVKDAAGYGLAQWTYWSRKQKLLEFARSERKSIGDGMMQMRFLMKELSVGLIGRLNAAQSASEAAKMFMLEFERPGDQSERAQNGRAKIAEEVYNKWKS